MIRHAFLSVVLLAAGFAHSEDVPPDNTLGVEIEGRFEPEPVEREIDRDEDGLDIVADIFPGTILISTGLDGFKMTRPNSELGVVEREEASQISTMPNLRVGLGGELGDFYADGTVGIGLLLNSRFRAMVYRGDVNLHYKFGRNGMIGPHVGVFQISDPEWSGSGDLDVDTETGYVIGAHIQIGYDISFVFSLDYMDSELDVSPSGAWSSNQDTLDFSGIHLQFGVRGKF